MKYKQLKEKAIHLRSLGQSFKQIADELGVSKSTSHTWTKGTELSDEARAELHKRFLFGQEASRKLQGKKYQKKLDRIERDQVAYLENLISIPDKLLCAMIYWCEGAKDSTTVRFTNSDPRLIVTFLHLFRTSFELDESKFRIIIHLHEYHNEQSQKEFWSRVTNISKEQFTKSYLKPHTGKVKRDNYPGCVNIKYYDAEIAKTLLILAKSFMKSDYGGVVQW